MDDLRFFAIALIIYSVAIFKYKKYAKANNKNPSLINYLIFIWIAILISLFFINPGLAGFLSWFLFATLFIRFYKIIKKK